MVGIFLVQQNIITRDQFFDISAVRDRETEPIGKIALREKMLTIRQVMNVLADQATNGGRFGEVAIESEFLTNQELWRLLFLQQEGRPGFLSVAIQLGIIDETVARDALKLFRTSNAEMLTRSEKV